MSSIKWVFTINNYTDETTAKLETAASFMRYLVYGKEIAPSTGTPHLQGFLYLRKKTRLNAVKNLIQCETAHLEIAKGSAEQAADYCKKDKNFKEFGICPKEGSTTTQEKWENAYTAAKENRLDDIPRDLYIRYMRTFETIALRYREDVCSLDTFDFHWYHGDTGTGKSVTARNTYPNHYLKGLNKWWDGYRTGQAVIIEEWHPMEKGLEDAMGHYLKQWCDHHPFPAEVKHGFIGKIRPESIVITSNYTMEECFHDPKVLEPLQRRIKVHHFYGDLNHLLSTQTIDL